MDTIRPKGTVSDRLKRLQTHPTIDRQTALANVNIPLYTQYLKKEACLVKAGSRPLPGPALDAFVGKSIEVAGKNVSRLLPAHIIALEAINSKILGMFSDSKEERDNAIKLKTLEQFDICFIFTTEDIDELLALAEKGPDAIRAESKAIVSKWEFAIVENVVLAVIEQIIRGFRGKVKLLSDLREGGQITFFQETEKPLTTKTESAGS